MTWRSASATSWRSNHFVLGEGGRLDEVTERFTVRAVVEIAGPAADPGLMPDFPGIADSDHCRDWEPGIPIDLDLIRDVDEAYWDEHRGTPKAFITVAAGKRMWSNRFGGLTAIRLDADRADAALERCRNDLDPRRRRDVLPGRPRPSPRLERNGHGFRRPLPRAERVPDDFGVPAHRAALRDRHRGTNDRDRYAACRGAATPRRSLAAADRRRAGRVRGERRRRGSRRRVHARRASGPADDLA